MIRCSVYRQVTRQLEATKPLEYTAWFNQPGYVRRLCHEVYVRKLGLIKACCMVSQTSGACGTLLIVKERKSDIARS